MGIYDRDYYSKQVRFVSPLGAQWKTSAVTWLIGINFAVWFLQLISPEVTRLLECTPARVVGGFEFWRPLTAAFCHDPRAFGHIFWNMLYLFFFGAPIERLYGRKDFIVFYLTVAFIANLAFVAVAYLFDSRSTLIPVIGASGCGLALVVLCALYYPHRTVILLFFPIPLWLLGVFLVVGDFFGFMGGVSGTAHVVHLAGAGMGLLYKFVDLRWSTLSARFGRWKFRRRARNVFRHPVQQDQSDGIPRFTEDIENQRLDRILKKIHTYGKDSLSEEEQIFLNLMSERYKQVRR